MDWTVQDLKNVNKIQKVDGKGSSIGVPDTVAIYLQKGIGGYPFCEGGGVDAVIQIENQKDCFVCEIKRLDEGNDALKWFYDSGTKNNINNVRRFWGKKLVEVFCLNLEMPYCESAGLKNKITNKGWSKAKELKDCLRNQDEEKFNKLESQFAWPITIGGELERNFFLPVKVKGWKKAQVVIQSTKKRCLIFHRKHKHTVDTAFKHLFGAKTSAYRGITKYTVPDELNAVEIDDIYKARALLCDIDKGLGKVYNASDLKLIKNSYDLLLNLKWSSVDVNSFTVTNKLKDVCIWVFDKPKDKELAKERVLEGWHDPAKVKKTLKNEKKKGKSKTPNA